MVDTLAPPAAAPLLRARNISKTFGATRALDGVDLDVRAGEVHAVVGQNGCGKSTLVKVLSGFHQVDPGHDTVVEIDGKAVQLHDAEASLDAGMRFVHQDLGLVPTMNTVENLALGRGFRTGAGRRILWREETADARRRMADLGYSFDLKAPVDSLRASERTGIAIARALNDIDKARILVIDEPTATLPQAEVDVLFRAIDYARGKGLGVIYISHRLDEIFRIADRVSVFRDGHRLGTHETKDLDEERLIALMVGEVDLRPDREDVPVVERLPVLEVRDVSGESILEASFTAHSGEILGIAGLTGSGRDELLGLVFGARRRTGRVEVDGTVVKAERPSAAIAAGVAFVPPDRHGQGSVTVMNVQDNCTITDLGRHSRRTGAIRRKEERAEVEGWIESLDVRPAWPDADFAALSGGNQQKIVLAKWLRMKPRVLLLDEPTQGVDVGAKAAIHELARDTAAGGAAVVIASSDEIELCDTCDRVLVLRDGEFAGELTGARITPHDIARLQL